MKSLIILFLALACVSGQFFNPFRAFGRRPRPPPPRPAPFNPRPAAAPASSGGSSPSCTNGFHVSSSRSFSWSAARNYCTSRGLKPSSLENAQKVGIAKNLVRSLPYFWTGGQKSGTNPTVNWPNGARSVPEWSNTGGARRPQPDNREGNENCVAILNNFYNDGIKFHDVACHHRKPALCEC